MEAFIFAVNAVLPIMLLVFLGYGLKRIGFIPAAFAPMANKLVFRVFLPVTLFLNVYGISADMSIGIGYILYAMVTVFVFFGLGNLLVVLVTKGNRRAPLLQSVFRSNFALIGIPLAEALYGSEGVAVAALLSAVAIPLYNVLAVLCFSIHSEGKRLNPLKILRDIAKNPLIIGVLTGALFLLAKNQLPGFALERAVPLYKTLSYLSGMATPLALITLGAQFEFSAVRGLRREIVTGVLCRLVIVPFLAIGTAYLLRSFTGAHFAAFVALYASPVAVSSVPMTQELGGDSELAGQLVVWTTLVSALTIFLFSFGLKSLGVFA